MAGVAIGWLGAVDLAIYLCAAIVLVCAYARSREPVLLWLAAPLAVLPMFGACAAAMELAWLTESGTIWLASLPAALGETPHVLVLGMVYVSEHLLWGMASLAGVIVLCQRLGRGVAEASSEKSAQSDTE